MNETERNQLRSYIIQLRRISAHREQGVEAEIRREYQKVLNKLQAIVSKYYAIYGNIDDSTMTRADLESASAYNNFLQDVVNNLDGINKPVENQIRQTIEDTYTTCYNGMVNAVKKSTGNSDLGILLSGLSATTPETVKNIIENPMDNLTLSTVLNRKRSQVVSDIKKNLSVGLANGDSYAKMAQRISKSLDSDYKKAMRIVRTESNRAINKGFQDVSNEASDMLLGSDYVEVKEWCSMEDESVRDTHNHLNGKKIHVQDEFESKGRKAKCPCGFGIPEEDINCRCFLAYEFMSREEFLKQGGVIPDEILEKEEELGLTRAYEDNIIIKETGGRYTVGSTAWFKQQDIREEQAKKAYKEIAQADNIQTIAEISGFSIEEIQQIKNHVFVDEHKLFDGIGRFSPDYNMAVAFKRLENRVPEERDILLLHHELFESQCEKKYNLTASEAHAMAKQKYDWDGLVYKLLGEDGEPDDLL